MDSSCCFSSLIRFHFTLKAEKQRLAEKEAVEEEALKLKIKVKDLSSQNEVMKKKM